MCRNFVLVSLPMSSTVVCRIEPTPAEPYFRTPGFLRASSISCVSVEARVLAHANKKRIEACDRNPFEIFDDFVVYVPGERAMRGVSTRNDQQGVAVRLAARHSLRGEAAGDAGLGLDDDRLPEPFRHLVSKKPADDVHVPSRR